MTNPATAETRSNIIELQERRLDRTVLRTYRTTVDLDDVVPNGNQPRMGPKEDDELQRQIEANEGLFEPPPCRTSSGPARKIQNHRR
jgi:ParB family chromosome partitioning protein